MSGESKLRAFGGRFVLDPYYAAPRLPGGERRASRGTGILRALDRIPPRSAALAGESAASGGSTLAMATARWDGGEGAKWPVDLATATYGPAGTSRTKIFGSLLTRRKPAASGLNEVKSARF